MKGQAFQGLMNLIKKNPGVAMDAGISAALTTGMGLLSGDPGAALKYGAADFLFSYPATLAVRGLRPKSPIQVKDMATGKITELKSHVLKCGDAREHWSVNTIWYGCILPGEAVHSTTGSSSTATADSSAKRTERFDQ
jgi:hypothetical protein